MTVDQDADDYFAGAGGWDLAAQDLGIHARGIENMKEARATRDAAGLTTIHDDVWTYVPDGRANGQIASPPCPTFSQAGKGTGRRSLETVVAAITDGAYKDLDYLRGYPVADDDDRTRLVLTPLHFATQHDYEWLAWEQVQSVLPAWEACGHVLREEGWHVWTGKVYAEQYGVPQARIRAVLIASRRRMVGRPAPTHSRYYRHDPARLDPGVPRWITMAEALGRGMTRRPSMTITGGGTASGGAEPFGNAARQGMLREFEAGHWATQRPSTTIVGTFRPDIVAAPGYRTTVSRQNAPGSVKITLEEAAALQTFPVDHPLQGKDGRRWLQIGNAVPVLMARAIEAEAAGIVTAQAAREQLELL